MSKLNLIGLAAAAAVAFVALTGCDSKPDNVAVETPSTSIAPEPSAVPVLGQPPAPDGAPANQATGQPAGQPAGQPGGQPTGQPPAWPSPEDCISYNPNTLSVKYEAGAFVVSDGSKVVVKVYGGSGESTGQQALALAQRFSRHCYIGRNNHRVEDRNAYVFDYWRDPSGKTPTIVDLEELCSDYNRNNLTVEDMGDGYGWRVKDHDHVLHLFDNETDARNGKLVLSKYNQICSIGDNDDGQDVANFML